MAIAERSLSSATTTATTGTTLSVTPTGMVTDDVMVATFASLGGTVTHTAPAGWTQIGSQVTQGGTSLSSWRKVAGSSEAGPYQWDTTAGANRRMVLFIRAFSGVDTTNPVDGTPQTAQSGSAASITHPASSASGAGRWWLLNSAKGTAAAGSSTLNTPAGFTETADACSAHGTLANVNAGLHHKSVSSGSTGTQLVDSSDGTNQPWAALSFLLTPTGAAVVDAVGAITGSLALSGVANIVGASSPATTTTIPSSVMGGGFENAGCFAPLGVGHQWYAAIGGDVMGTHVTSDGVNWKPSNKGIRFGLHRIAAIIGSATVANRLYCFCSTQGDGVGGSPGGTVLQGAYSASTGLVTWTTLATTTAGAAAGVPDSGQPRQAGRLLALDEANDTLYVGTTDGVARVTISTGSTTNARALDNEGVTGLLLDPSNPQIGWATTSARLGASTGGVWRLTNLRSGTPTETRHSTWVNPQDLCLVDIGGGTRYVFVAAWTGGIRRWTVSTDITTGWTDVTNDYNGGGDGSAAIDGFFNDSNSSIILVAANAGPTARTSAGGVSNDGGANWQNEVTAWNVSYIPFGETVNWWLSQDAPFMMLDQGRYDCVSVQIDPANPLRMHLVGRSGVDRTINGGSTWKPSIRGQCATVAWTVAARPQFGDQARVGDGDWTTLGSTAGFVGDMPLMNRPQSGTGMGLMYRSDGSALAVAMGETSSNAQGEVWTTTNPAAAAPTWVDEGFGAASTAPCHGVAIGDNAAATQVLLTVQSGNIRRKVGAGSIATVQSGVGTGSMNAHFCWPNGATGRQWIFLSSPNGLWRSDDWGATWARPSGCTWTNSSEYTGNIFHDPGNLNTLYLTRDDGTGPGTGLFKITNATGTPTVTAIGPTVTDPGPCAVDPISGIVYLAVRAEESGGTKLYASPSDNPGGATTFADITDAQWAAGPFEPADMCVTWSGKILVSSKQGGYYVATRAGGAPQVVLAEATLLVSTAATSTSPTYLDLYTDLFDTAATGGVRLEASADVVSAVAGVVTATATLPVGATLLRGVAEVPTAAASAGVTAGTPFFDGVRRPRPLVLVGLGNSIDPGAQYLHLGVGPGLGTCLLAGGTWMDLGMGAARNIRSITPGTPRGRDNPLDPAAPSTLSIVLRNDGGEYDPDNPASPFQGLDIGCPIDVRAEWPLGTIWRRFVGEITGIALDPSTPAPTVTLTCADPLEKLGRTTLTGTTTPAGDGDRTGTRMGRILDQAAFSTGLRDLDTGYTVVAPTVFGDSALELLRNTERTEFGWLFADGSGQIVFYDRHHLATDPRSTTIQAVFSDSGATAVVGMAEMEVDWARDRIWNDVHVTRDPTPTTLQPRPGEWSDENPDEPAEQVATDFDPEPNWGTLSMPAITGVLFVHDTQSKAMAEYLLGRFNRSQPRVRRIRVNLLRRDLWDLLLGLQIGDRIQVVRDYGPRTITEELLISAMAEQITADPSWELTLDLTQPPDTPTLWRLGTAALGSGRLGW